MSHVRALRRPTGPRRRKVTRRGAALLEDGQEVAVEIWPEDPQIDELAADIIEALEARPKARAAFEAQAQFYRNGWLRWIDVTKRRPDLRAERIMEMLRVLEAGRKEHP